jgi:hypothetical protein
MLGKLSGIALAAMIATGFGVAGAGAAGPSGVSPRALETASPATVGVIEVSDHRSRRREWREERREWREDRREWREDRRDRRRHYRRHYDRPRASIEFHFGTPSYRYYEPPVYVAPRRHYGLSSAHYRWCEWRYRSYRSWDNTFQPYHGPRTQCISPYI